MVVYTRRKGYKVHHCRNPWYKVKTYTLEDLTRIISRKLHVDKKLVTNMLLGFSEICGEYLVDIHVVSKLNPSAPKWFSKRHRKGSISKRKISKLINASKPQKGTTNE